MCRISFDSSVHSALNEPKIVENTQRVQKLSRSYTAVASILKNNLDRRRRQKATDGPAISHPNIRGSRYFH